MISSMLYCDGGCDATVPPAVSKRGPGAADECLRAALAAGWYLCQDGDFCAACAASRMKPAALPSPVGPPTFTGD